MSTTYGSYLIAEAITFRYVSRSLYAESVCTVSPWYLAFTRGSTVLRVASGISESLSNNKQRYGRVESVI